MNAIWEEYKCYSVLLQKGKQIIAYSEIVEPKYDIF